MIKKMKDIGIPWIGQIPEDWEVCKVKFLCEEIFSGGTPSTTNDSYWNGNIPWLQSGKIQNDYIFEYDRTITEKGLENSSTKMVKRDSILLAMTGATCSNVGYLTFDSCANQSVMAYIPLKTTIPKFLFYVLMACKNNILLHKNGGAQSGINGEVCQNLFVPKITTDLQQKIVEILDKKCGQIDELIKVEENAIEKLKEYKTSLITKDVTKGLDPNAKMKDSGIPWIGQIPQDWNVGRLKFYLSEPLKYGANENGCPYDENQPRYIRITDIIENNKLIQDKENMQSLEINKANNFLLKKGDLLFARSGATVGKTFLFLEENIKAAFAGYLIAARVNQNFLNYKYLYYFTLSNCYNKWKNNIFIQSTIQNIGANKYNDLELTIPSVSIQRQIVEYLDKRCEEIDNLLKIKQEKIEKLKEYKKSLIYQYVTGKKEVL